MRRPDRQREPDPWCRRIGMIVGATVLVAILAAGSLGAAGVTGGGGAVVLLLVLVLGMALAAVLALATSAIDEFRGRPVTWRRPLLGVVLLLVAMALSAMTAVVL